LSSIANSRWADRRHNRSLPSQLKPTAEATWLCLGLRSQVRPYNA
jgi:hypothetical protein